MFNPMAIFQMLGMNQQQFGQAQQNFQQDPTAAMNQMAKSGQIGSIDPSQGQRVFQWIANSGHFSQDQVNILQQMAGQSYMNLKNGGR